MEVPVRLWKDLVQKQARGTTVSILDHNIRRLEMELKSLRHREELLEYYLSTSTLSDKLSREYLPSALEHMRTKIDDVTMEVASMRDECDAQSKGKA